ncbi:MAG TPA: hypothetical protein VFF06_19635 [Polyangia bacterium]|nr:hypothetical protein [Polyangia bacterium]
MRRTGVSLVCGVLVLGAAWPLFAAEKTVCVSVTVKRPSAEAAAESGADVGVPIGQSAVSYLKRLIEYFVTHERGYSAVESGCLEHLDVELYPLTQGWTAFARYSGTGREERIDYLFSDELSQFAERAVLALLYDKPINTTILRDTVLRADSKRAAQRVRGTNHFVMGLGTQLRGGSLPTARASDGTAPGSVRLFGPIALSLGYRGKFESWGLEAMFGLGIGTSKSGLQQNTEGGHVDYGGNVSASLHFMRYLNPRGLSSFYVGAGGSFEVLWFYQINPLDSRAAHGDRYTLASGGFDVDLIGGVEFMRASRVQFYLQAALLVPAYVVQNGDGAANISTWFPGAALTLGMIF